jgi:hypothetical protein
MPEVAGKEKRRESSVRGAVNGHIGSHYAIYKRNHRPANEAHVAHLPMMKIRGLHDRAATALNVPGRAPP